MTQMTIVGIVRDHSVSMSSLRQGALKDYNSQLDVLKTQKNTFLSVVECGGIVRVDFSNIPVSRVLPLSYYNAGGNSTPLWSSVNKIIDITKHNIKISDDIAFLIMVITDGEENSSTVRIDDLKRRIQKLQATDKWTFVFRVPRDHAANLQQLGIPAGNIMEWDQTEESLHLSSVSTVDATTRYFNARSMGVTSTNKFYTDLSSVKPADLKRELDDVTKKIRVESVWSEDDGSQIRDFCIKSFGEFSLGRAYYQLSKTEIVQQSKSLIIKHKKKGRYYSGPNVRDILGLPSYGEIKLVPGNHPDYEVYVQSTSVNRKVVTKTKVLYL